jgi:two-component sensor histidine kinase
VVHELITNAVNHGALAEDDGQLDIAWAIDGDTFAVTWVESGGATVEKPARQGEG